MIGLYHLPLLGETYPGPVTKTLDSLNPGMNDIALSSCVIISMYETECSLFCLAHKPWYPKLELIIQLCSMEEGNQVGTTSLRRPVNRLLQLIERVNSQATRRFW